MRQSLGRLILLVVVVVLIFGMYRLLTVQPLEQAAFFDSGRWPYLMVADTGQGMDAPPYTTAAFDAALQAGASGLYLPLWQTADGHLAVLGSPDLSLSTDGSGQVSDLTLAELASLDAGYRFDPAGDGSYPWRGQGQHPLSLPAVLEAYPEARLVVSLEQPNLTGLAALLQAVDAAGARDRVLAVVDDQQLVDTLRQQAPGLATTYTAQETDGFLAADRLRLVAFYRPAAQALILDGDQIGQRLVRAAHSRGVSVLARGGPAASDTEMQGWIDQGADGVIAGSVASIAGLPAAR
jgi:glycerophosphoryl diester phosphodiesterase